MSLTFTGLIPGGRGGCLEGWKNSFRRSVKLPKLPPQSTSRRLLTTVLETAGAEKKNRKLSRMPEPKVFLVNGTSLRSVILTGRSVRNCFRLDQKLSGIKCDGTPKSGNAAFETGIISSGPERLGRPTSSGRRLMKSCTLFLSTRIDAGHP